MHTETLTYTDAGTTLKGFLAYDEKKTGKRPGILVMPEAFGLGKNAKNRAKMLAELGYVALGGDPFGDGREFTDLQEAIKVAGALMADPAKFRARARVGIDKLASLPQVDPNRSRASATAWAARSRSNSRATARRCAGSCRFTADCRRSARPPGGQSKSPRVSRRGRPDDPDRRT